MCKYGLVCKQDVFFVRVIGRLQESHSIHGSPPPFAIQKIGGPETYDLETQTYQKFIDKIYMM